MLAEYLLFLLKVATIVVAIIAIIVAGVAVKKQEKQEEKLEVEFLNEKFTDMQDELVSNWLDSKELKKIAKAKKTEAKKTDKKAKPRVFVLDFDGDLEASDTPILAKQIDLLIDILRPEDEVVLRLESGGGYVHAYGLASAQLMRLQASEANFSVCVDKVAASGGYMMASCAKNLYAAPFAIIGSIGVVAEMPNFHKLLQKNSVDYEVLTAGEYKRTLTMFGENTEKARTKFINELEDTHVLFKNFVSNNRKNLAIDEVASGEIWYGQQAVQKNLIDKVITSSAYLLERSKQADLYSVSFKQKQNLIEKITESFSSKLLKKVSILLSKSRLPLK